MNETINKFLTDALKMILSVIASIILTPIFIVVVPFSIYNAIRGIKLNKNDKSPYVK